VRSKWLDWSPAERIIEKGSNPDPTKPAELGFEGFEGSTPRGFPDIHGASPEGSSWPTASLDAERRFGQPHAKLFPFIGRKVRTPDGPGTLLQVFVDRVTVVLDSELSRCSFFAPGQIEPVSWESPE
jgi:hypothetical protein